MSDVNTQTGEVTVYDGVKGDGLRAELTSLNEGGSISGFYSTMAGNTPKERMAVAVALSGSEPIAESIVGKVVFIKHVIIQAADMTDETTKQPVVVPRVILIDDEGKGYHGISAPLYRDVTNLLGTVGEPDAWEGDAVAVRVTKEGSGSRRYFTLAVLGFKSDVEAAAKAK